MDVTNKKDIYVRKMEDWVDEKKRDRESGRGTDRRA